jgi:hypothetical protein
MTAATRGFPVTFIEQTSPVILSLPCFESAGACMDSDTGRWSQKHPAVQYLRAFVALVSEGCLHGVTPPLPLQ